MHDHIHVLEEGWYYLILVIDSHSNKIINYHFSQQITADVIDKNSKNTYVVQKPKNLIFLHTDLRL